MHSIPITVMKTGFDMTAWQLHRLEMQGFTESVKSEYRFAIAKNWR